MGRRSRVCPYADRWTRSLELAQQFAVKDVVVAMPQLPRERLLHLISLCEGYVESIRVVPDMFGLASAGVEAEDLDGVLLLHMRCNLAKPWNLAAEACVRPSRRKRDRPAASPRFRSRRARHSFGFTRAGILFPTTTRAQAPSVSVREVSHHVRR